MEYNIVAKEIAQKVFKDSGLPNIGKASIREIKKLVDNLENASKVKFVRMEMGIPGLPPAQKVLKHRSSRCKRYRLTISRH